MDKERHYHELHLSDVLVLTCGVCCLWAAGAFYVREVQAAPVPPPRWWIWIVDSGALFAAVASVVCLVLVYSKRCVERREIRPGATGLLCGSIVMAIRELPMVVGRLLDQPDMNLRWDIRGLPACVGSGVLSVWLVIIFTGKWRAPACKLEWLSRRIAFGWILLAVLFFWFRSFAMY